MDQRTPVVDVSIGEIAASVALYLIGGFFAYLLPALLAASR